MFKVIHFKRKTFFIDNEEKSNEISETLHLQQKTEIFDVLGIVKTETQVKIKPKDIESNICLSEVQSNSVEVKTKHDFS